MAADEDILNYDLFAGDETPVTVFANKMVKTRKEHTCAICWDAIPPGGHVRAQTERDDDDKIVKTFYVCPTCGEAAAIAGTRDDPNGDRISDRHDIGWRKNNPSLAKLFDEPRETA